MEHLVGTIHLSVWSIFTYLIQKYFGKEELCIETEEVEEEKEEEEEVKVEEKGDKLK